MLFKKITPIILICLLVLTGIPIDNYISVASSGIPYLSVNYDDVTNAQYQEAVTDVKTLGISTKNLDNVPIDYKIYAMYQIQAYGSPSFSDIKTKDNFPELARDEFRTLGLNFSGSTIYNDLFPDDYPGSTALLAKKWSNYYASKNRASWEDLSPEMMEYMYTTTGVLDDGVDTGYSMQQIFGNASSSYSYKQDFIEIMTLSGFARKGSFRGWIYSSNLKKYLYDSFTVPSMNGAAHLNAVIETDEDVYTIKPDESYVDVEVTITGELDTSGAFLESFISESWVEFESAKKEGRSATFIKRYKKSHLSEGKNTIEIEGLAGIASGFAHDTPVEVTGETSFTIMVNTEELAVDLKGPTTADINTEFTVYDASFIPSGKTIKESILEKKINSGNYSELDEWNGNRYTDTGTGKMSITYRLTILLNDGQTDSDTHTVNICDGRVVNGTADLELDEYTYEGHPTYARDVSYFDVEGETYSAARAYEEGLAHNDFDVTNCDSSKYSMKSISDTKEKITFDEAGFYNVELEVETKDDEELFDSDTIEVRRTPYIEAFIGGTQKQNRKQILSISSAIHPDYAINNFYVEIKDVKTGEKVHLTSSKKNSTNIKTRDITTSSTDYFQNYTLEFLTKNNTEKVYQYTVYVKDSKGDTDTVSDYFTVYPDKAPEAVINLADTFYRNEGSDIAQIEVEDLTVSSDGDQVARTWTVAFDTDHDSSFTDEKYVNIKTLDYTDLSFGSMQEIKFPKTGVGKAKIKLDVKEVWTEPTLEEYVTSADRLTDYTTDITEVKNIAPMVSVEPIHAHPIDILLLTTQKNYNSVKNNLATLDTLLKESAIDAKINLQALDRKASMSDGAVVDLIANVEAGDFNRHMILIDNKQLYRVVPSGINAEYESILPYKIQALNAETGSVKWTYSMGAEENFSLNQDHEQKYLYVVKEDETTLIINKETGAKIGDLNFEADGSIYTTDENIYLFNNASVEKYSIVSNKLTTVLDEGCTKTYMEKGKVCFVSVDQYNKPFRGKYALDTDDYECEYIEALDRDKSIYDEFYYDDTVKYNFNFKDIDSYGTVLVEQALYYPRYHGTYARDGDYIYWVISPDNKLVKRIFGKSPLRNSHKTNAGLIKDEKGRAEHFFYGISEGDSDELHTFVYEIYGNRSVRHSKGAGSSCEVKFGINTGNDLYMLVGGQYLELQYGVRSRGYTFKVRLSDFTTSSSDKFESSYDEEHAISELYAATVWDNVRYQHKINKQYLRTLRFEQTLDDLLERAVHRYGDFDEDYQKYVIVLDDTFYKDTTTPNGVIAKLKENGVELIYIGDNIASNPNSYGSKIVSAVGGSKIEYTTNMALNFTRLSTMLESLIDKVEHSAKISIKNSDTLRLRKTIDLDPSAKYEYEYDIKYSKDFTGKNKNILSVSTGTSTISNYGLKLTGASGSIKGYGYLEDVLYEDFNGPVIHRDLELLETTGSHPVRWLHGFFGTWVKNGTQKGTIKCTMEKEGIIKFDVLGEIASSKSYIKVYDNGTEIYALDSKGKHIDAWPYYSIFVPLSKGEHEIEVRTYKKSNSTSGNLGAIDNFEIKYIHDFGTNNKRDTGIAPQTKTSKIKADTWYHVENSFTTPSETCQLVDISAGRKTTENWSDWSLQPIITGTHGLQLDTANNVAKTVDKNRSRSEFTVTVPDNHMVNVKCAISVEMKRSDVGAFYHGTLGYKEYDADDYPTKHFDMNLPPGEHTFGANLRYERKDRWIYTKATISKVEITDLGIPTDTGKNYFEHKKSNATSTLDLLISGNNYDTQIANFKLYKVIKDKKYLVLEDDFITDDKFDDTWTIVKGKASSTVELVEESNLTEDEDVPLIYSKGQLILYNVYYNDYENDPSKKQYWQYTHTPFNDGLHPEQGKILNAPIDRFWVDGKYVVKHWQEDSTGVTAYDKVSNKEEITFYVQGNSTAAPEVTYIKTIPATVKEGQSYKVEIGVDDEDLDDLDTTIELYLNNQLIYTYNKNNVSAISNVYPPIVSGTAPKAEVGKYTIVATARDDTGVGMRSYEFTVVSEGKVEGEVHHVEQWDINRKKYNLSKTGDEEKPRGYNVFWSGERFVLRSETEGKPNRVHVEILNEGYETELTTIDDRDTWEGHIWDESMMVRDNFVIIKWGRYAPETLTFRFTAYFDSGITRTHDVEIIVDHQDPYWRLHRKY